MWYPSQIEDTKNTLKEWLKDGRFEFIMGGYVMHDESSTHFQHIIDNMRIGLQFLKKEFDFTPTIAWFIDPFGHSASNAYMIKEMGFETIVYVRIDYNEKDIRKNQKSMEFHWRPYFDIDQEKLYHSKSNEIRDPKDSSIFTYITAEHYSPFADFGKLNQDKEIKYTEEDLTKEVNKFVGEIKRQSSYYMHKELIYWFGRDFTFQKASINFKNLEPFMKKINENKDYKIKIFYSTPTRYFNIVKNLKLEFPTYENNDFFPYTDKEYAYWSGYFTSRPNLKVRVREAGNVLERASSILVENILNGDISLVKDQLKSIFNLREKLAICQHHDAVAGTSKDYVSMDYENMLVNSSKEVISNVIDKVIEENVKKNIKSCIIGYSNTECEDIDSFFNREGFSQVLFYNNRIDQKDFFVKLKLRNPKVEIYKNDKKTIIKSDIICQLTHETVKEFPCYIYFKLNLSKDYPYNSIFIKKIDIDKSLAKIKIDENPKIKIKDVWNFN